MNTNTLRGIFPEHKVPAKKNFIKENVRYIKQIQGLLQSMNEPQYTNNPRNASENLQPRDPPYLQVQSKYLSHLKQSSQPTSSHQVQHKILRAGSSNETQQVRKPQKPIKKVFSGKPETPVSKEQLQIKQLRQFGQVTRRPQDECPEKFTNRSTQTECHDDPSRIYDKGIIIFPSSSVVHAINAGKKKEKKLLKHDERGDSVRSDKKGDLIDRVQNLELEDRDFIKENMMAVKNRHHKQESRKDPSQVPEHYQKGVLPKYLKDKKDDQKEPTDEPECPRGHVLLPEEERKETLRVLRQSYADRIQELNAMPVRNDTLKMRKRKIELEEELKKIDEGIKVFQRPKVFVKINA